MDQETTKDQETKNKIRTKDQASHSPFPNEKRSATHTRLHGTMTRTHDPEVPLAPYEDRSPKHKSQRDEGEKESKKKRWEAGEAGGREGGSQARDQMEPKDEEKDVETQGEKEKGEGREAEKTETAPARPA